VPLSKDQAQPCSLGEEDVSELGRSANQSNLISKWLSHSHSVVAMKCSAVYHTAPGGAGFLSLQLYCGALTFQTKLKASLRLQAWNETLIFYRV